MNHIGIDISLVRDFRDRPHEKFPNLYRKMFTIGEIQDCLYKNDPYPSFAARFSAKEAVIKASPALLTAGDIEIKTVERKPVVYIHGEQDRRYAVSMTHTAEQAMAVALYDD